MSEPSTQTPPPPAPPQQGGDSDRTIMLILSYLGILGLIPLLMKKEDSEVQWHAKHGLVLFGAAIILMFVLMFLGMVPYLGCVAALAAPFAWIAYLVLAILCMVKAVNGQRFTIPWLSDFADKF